MWDQWVAEISRPRRDDLDRGMLLLQEIKEYGPAVLGREAATAEYLSEATFAEVLIHAVQAESEATSQGQYPPRGHGLDELLDDRNAEDGDTSE